MIHIEKSYRYLLVAFLSSCAPNTEVLDDPYYLTYSADNSHRIFGFYYSWMFLHETYSDGTTRSTRGLLTSQNPTGFAGSLSDSTIEGTFTKSDVSEGSSIKSFWQNCPNVQLYKLSIFYPSGGTTVTFEGNVDGCR